MSKNIDINQITRGLKSATLKLKTYAWFVFIITILLIYSFLVVRVSLLSDPKPDEAAVEEQINTVKRLKIDQNAINQIEKLEDQNIGVQSLFEEARDNPF